MYVWWSHDSERKYCLACLLGSRSFLLEHSTIPDGNRTLQLYHIQNGTSILKLHTWQLLSNTVNCLQFIFGTVMSQNIYIIELITSLAWGDSESGKRMSNSTIKSPLLWGCLGRGKPSPCIRRVVVGLVTSLRRSGSFRPSRVGICVVVPTRAWNKEEHRVRNMWLLWYQFNYHQ